MCVCGCTPVAAPLRHHPTYPTDRLTKPTLPPLPQPQNSNLVLEADREARRAAGEATGEVETWDDRKLAGKRMGDRVGLTRAPEVEDRMKKAKEK